MRCDWVFVVVGQHYRASDKCQREKRKTINGDDLLWAMATLGFEDYIEPLKVYLQKYREMEEAVQVPKGWANKQHTIKEWVICNLRIFLLAM
uniref:Transcription factor CBF/NF-Y/archaeal histone domain-containing protein n=1 Tax=Oryza nivara TaxID=4536 RepID=A0A0E0HFN7_ORYNI